MIKKYYPISLLAVLMAVFGSLATVSAQTVGGSIAGGAITRGGTSRATVYLSMPAGLHVNSNRPNSEYAIPTTVRASAKGLRLSAVRYPRGHNRKFEFSQDTINVYDGRVAFGFNVTVPPTYKGNTVRVSVAVKYQACTNEVCYPPKTKNITLTARVR
jgi:DsbC/DsbD-like thiol-disulfide interchange protein